jgi:hypothetical protein
MTSDPVGGLELIGISVHITAGVEVHVGRTGKTTRGQGHQDHPEYEPSTHRRISLSSFARLNAREDRSIHSAGCLITTYLLLHERLLVLAEATRTFSEATTDPQALLGTAARRTEISTLRGSETVLLVEGRATRDTERPV